MQLQLDVIHVVRVRLDEPLDRATDVLAAEERARAARFVFDRDRRRFVVAHARMRLALGTCLGRSAESLRFEVGGRGKPRLVDASPDVRFSLSHSGERALLAIALGQEVGVDIEEHRPIDVLELGRRLFTPREAEDVKAMVALEQAHAFFRCWTRKEALVKALGAGLSRPLDGFEVGVGPGPSLRPTNEDLTTVAPGGWRIVSLDTEPGYSAALAAPAAPWRVVQWDASGSTFRRLNDQIPP